MFLLSTWIDEYLRLLLLGSICVFFSLFLLTLTIWLGCKGDQILSYTNLKGSYECGFSPLGDARGNFQIHFYMIALMFAIFDIEIVLLLPWAINIGALNQTGTLCIVFVLFLLGCGILYEILGGSLAWFFETTKNRPDDHV